MAKGENGKYAKWAMGIIGTILAVFLTALIGMANAANEKQDTTLTDHGARIRENTEGRKVNDTRYEFIQKSLERIENKLEKGDTE